MSIHFTICIKSQINRHSQTQLLYSIITEHLPSVKKEITEKISNIESELRKLGEPLPTDPTKLNHF